MKRLSGLTLTVISLCLFLLCGTAWAIELRFAPEPGTEYRVHYNEEIKWNYPTLKMQGDLKKAYSIEWTIGGRDAKLGHRTARGQFTKVYLRSQGIRGDREFNQNISWTRDKGYAPGGDTPAQRQSIDSEIRAGSTIVLDDQLHPKRGST